jgi:type I restriction enzyme, S subunit
MAKQQLEMRPDYEAMVRQILVQAVPQAEVWAFGSRANWTSRDTSDLDIVLRCPGALESPFPFALVNGLKEAFDESDVPFLVDVLDWATVSPKFRQVIEREYVVIQPPPLLNDWKECRLGDFLSVKHGFAFKGELFTDSKTDYFVLTPGNFSIGGGFNYPGKPKYYLGTPPQDYVMSTDDIIVTMTDLSKTGDTLGYSALIPNDGALYLHNQRVGKVEFHKSGLDKKFTYWLMRTDVYRHEILASASGTSIKHTSPSRIEAYKFLCPPLPEQRAIAEVLGVLDDKIDLNRRMNETLEATARALFKSWFVDFDPVHQNMAGVMNAGVMNHAPTKNEPGVGAQFIASALQPASTPAVLPPDLASLFPANQNMAHSNVGDTLVVSRPDASVPSTGSTMPTHDGTPQGCPLPIPVLPPDLAALFPASFTDSPLGPIPTGWRVEPIGNLANCLGGGTPSTTEPAFWENGIHYWATPKDLSSLNAPILWGTDRLITDKGLAKITSSLLPIGTILLSSRAPIGYVAVAQVPVAINQGFIGLVCDKGIPNSYIWQWVMQNMDNIKGRANGSTFMEISKAVFRPIDTLLPDDKVLQAFDNVCQPIIQKIAGLVKQSQTLAQTRDALLPKLMSGQLRVKDAQQLVEGLIG